MDEFIYLGKIVNTHGIKGELRIISNFKYKEKAFLQNRRIYIGEEHIEEVINTYRKHKMFDMVTLKGYTNINEVLKYINKNVYIKRNDLNLTSGEYLDKDLINLSVLFNSKMIGRVLALRDEGSGNKVLEIITDNKNVLIPFHKDFVKNIDFDNNIIELDLIEGMI